MPFFYELYRLYPDRGMEPKVLVEAALRDYHILFADNQLQLVPRNERELSLAEKRQTFQALYDIAGAAMKDPNDMSRGSKVITLFDCLFLPLKREWGLSDNAMGQVYWDFHRLVRRTRRNDYNLPTSSATLIQRAWRSRKLPPVLADSEIRDLLKRSPVTVPYPAPRPANGNSVNPDAAKEWIDRHPTSYQDCAHKFIDVLCHRSQAQFEKRLQQSVESFNRRLASYPIDQQEFVIVLPQGYQQASNTWVTALALPHFRKCPVQIISKDQVESFLAEHPQVKHAVLLDDASALSNSKFRVEQW